MGKRLLVLVAVAVSVLATSCVTEGVRPVGDMGSGGTPPGLWHSLGGDGCYWARLRDFSGNLDSIIANDFSTGGPVYVEVLPTDTGFENHGCIPFWQEPGPFAKPLATPGANFGPGMFQMNYELAPGSYVAPGGSGCYWARLRGFTGTLDDIIANNLSRGGPVAVNLDGTERGFESHGCGEWTKVA